jgi:hypothetical protein
MPQFGFSVDSTFVIATNRRGDVGEICCLIRIMAPTIWSDHHDKSRASIFFFFKRAPLLKLRLVARSCCSPYNEKIHTSGRHH